MKLCTRKSLVQSVFLALICILGLSSSSWGAEFWLRAETLTKTMPDASEVTMWGFAQCNDGTYTSCTSATVPGPRLTVPAGDTVLTVHMRNNLTGPFVEPISLVIPGQAIVPVPVRNPDGRVRSFTTETPPDNATTVTYAWTSMKTGTYLYQSGSHPAVQVQMGLYGAVTRNAAAGQAYGPSTAYAAEAIMLFSEIDPVLHGHVAAGTYGQLPPTGITSTMNYEPKYFLINGEPYTPAAPSISAGIAGQNLLLRFLSAGLKHRVPTIYGLNFSLVAEDGNPYPYPREQYSLLLSPGKTLDALVTATPQGEFPVYDRRLGLTNNAAPYGGMLTYLSNLPLTITTSSLPSGVVGTAYPATTLTATGGSGAKTWSISAGALPGGLTLSAAGVITGTPTAQGTFNFTVQVTDTSGTATAPLSIIVTAPPLVITTSSLPSGVVGTAYPATTLTATGGFGAKTWSISTGALPGGLTLSAAGVITGTPTAQGTFNFTVQVTDTSGTATAPLSIIVTAPPLVITTSSLPSGVVGTAYPATTLTATGGSGAKTWSISAGALPGGLTLSAAGVITGTPTVSGTFNFTVRVTDASGTTTKALSIIVTASSLPLSITTSSLPAGIVGTAYPATTLTATGGFGAKTWSVVAGGGPGGSGGALPGGLTLSAGGIITGTPTVSGTFNFTVRVTDSSGTATRPLSIIVTASPLPLSITTSSLPSGVVGTAYPATTLTATGGFGAKTWSISAGALPGGLTLSAAGVITGTPTVSGTFNFTVRVTDASGTTTKALSIIVTASSLPLSITTSSLPAGIVGTAYPATTLTATGGFGAKTWSVVAGGGPGGSAGALPGGLTLSAGGIITGTPTVSGTFNFTVRVTDSSGTTTKALSIIVTVGP